MAAVRITAALSIPEHEIEEKFVHASGPGGQNVNKVATAVQLRFDVARSPSLSESMRSRLMGLAGRRLTNEGVLVLSAQRFRTQERNPADARERLAALIRKAAIEPAARHPTRPTLASKVRRYESKIARSSIKKHRSKPITEY